MELCMPVKSVCDEIVSRFSPRKIILFNYKQDVAGEPRSFKICVVVHADNKDELERRIYLEVDSEIPYDILIYTPEEWETLSRREDCFAYRINKKGTVIYDQAP